MTYIHDAKPATYDHVARECKHCREPQQVFYRRHKSDDPLRCTVCEQPERTDDEQTPTPVTDDVPHGWERVPGLRDYLRHVATGAIVYPRKGRWCDNRTGKAYESRDAAMSAAVDRGQSKPESERPALVWRTLLKKPYNGKPQYTVRDDDNECALGVVFWATNTWCTWCAGFYDDLEAAKRAAEQAYLAERSERDDEPEIEEERDDPATLKARIAELEEERDELARRAVLQAHSEADRVERWHRTRDAALAGLLAHSDNDGSAKELAILNARSIADVEHGQLKQEEPRP